MQCNADLDDDLFVKVKPTTITTTVAIAMKVKLDQLIGFHNDTN